MVTKDSQGRITNVSLDDPTNHGHSVCVYCVKDMPRCWDVICAVCGNASCHDCATAKSGYWFCSTCIREYPQNLGLAKANCASRRTFLTGVPNAKYLLQDIVSQLESCCYENEVGPLELNTTFVALKELAYG